MIKRRIAWLLAAVLMLALLAGCQITINKDDGVKNPDPETAVAGVMSQFIEKHQEELPALMEVDAETLEAVYGIPADWVTAYACRIPMMNVHATEVFVAHAKPDHLEEVKAAVQARQEALEATWEMYLPEQYDLVRSSVTEVYGNYVLYAVTEHADSIRVIFNQNTR